MKKLIALLVILFAAFFLTASAQTQTTCQPVLGGEPGEVICEPATSPLPPGCQPEGGGGMICESAPTNSTCTTCSTTGPTGTLTVNPGTVTSGQSTTLSWQTTNATGCQIEGVGPVEPSGTRSIIVSQSTTFRLACIEPNKAGATLQAVAQAAVTATPPRSQQTTPPPQIQNKIVTDPCTDGEGSMLEYCPLEPLPGFTNLSDLNFAALLGLLFNVLFTAGALFAVVMLVFGGITYMVSGAVGEIGEAKRRMWAAVWGLVILAGAWLILFTINPQLLNFNLSILGTEAPRESYINTTGGVGGAPKDRDTEACTNQPGFTIQYQIDGSWRCVQNSGR